MEARIYSYRIGHTVADYDIAEGGCYGSSWGLTDLYEECENNLKTILESGEDFRASWDSKKELQSATLMRIGGVMKITVSVWMDDLWEQDDLIYDAYYDVKKSEEELSEDMLNEIRDLAFELECDDSTSVSWEGECSDYDAIMEHIEQLTSEADSQLDKWYACLKEIIREVA